MITVQVTSDVKPTHVALRYTQTYSTKRRDFRFYRKDVDPEDPCVFPEIKLPFGPLHPKFGGDCFSWKYWHS